MKILANDGISNSGKQHLEKAGFKVFTSKIPQEDLIEFINSEKIDVVLVRSATKVRKATIDACPSLKIIGRGGVGMDNIDVTYAKNKGLHVINTPAASSKSVAELVFAHLYGGARFLYDANRKMPLEGDSQFKDLKKSYGKGVELRGKTIGIIGFGKIGQEVAKIAIGIGMKVLASDPFIERATLKLNFFDGQTIGFDLETVSMEDLLKQSDFISLHVPAQKKYIIDQDQFDLMKPGVGLVNAARGGVINEVALVDALNKGKLSFAALDTYENEPKPAIQLLMNNKLSLSPHIGAATVEAQDRIGLELATQIIDILKSVLGR